LDYLRQALKDLTGTDAPEKFTLDTSYSKNSKIVEFVKKLIQSKNDSELNELVIRGVDNDNFGFVFNVDSFVQRISLSSKKNENGKFDAELIKRELLNRNRFLASVNEILLISFRTLINSSFRLKNFFVTKWRCNFSCSILSNIFST
jgi:hypothetical protein